MFEIHRIAVCMQQKSLSQISDKNKLCHNVKLFDIPTQVMLCYSNFIVGLFVNILL